MRHSDIGLTMNVYTDERLLETSVAVELLPELPIANEPKRPRTVTTAGTFDTDKTSVTESKTDKMGGSGRPVAKRENPAKRRVLQGFSQSGRPASHHG